MASLSRPAHLPHQLATLTRPAMSARQVDNSSSLTKSTLSMFTHQVRALGQLSGSAHQVTPTQSPQRVDSLSQLTKSAHPMVLPPCLSKLARHCACQVAQLSCFSKPTHHVGSPTRLLKHARQVTPPSRLFKYARQVDSKFAHQVTPPKRLIKVSL